LLPDADRAGHDRTLGLFARLEVAAGDEKLVEALFTQIAGVSGFWFAVFGLPPPIRSGSGSPKLVSKVEISESVKRLVSESFSKEIHRPAMPEENLREEIKEMMVENLMLKVTKEEIADDLPLFGPGGLGLDSIDALELVVSLEKKFGVSVANSETARQALASVNTIHDYVVANRKPS
jgi:acyl carrier protein